MKTKTDWISISLVVFAILTVLKLIEFITVSWWWVLSPLMFFVIILMALVIAGVIHYLKNK